jgi:hypothetical protein
MMTEGAQQDADRALVKRIYDHASQGGVTYTVECFMAAMALLGQRVRVTLKPKKLSPGRDGARERHGDE